MSSLKTQAQELLDRSRQLQCDEGYSSPMGFTSVDGPQTKKWLNDIKIFASKLPDNYPLKKEIESSYFHRTRASTFKNMVSYLESIITDDFDEVLQTSGDGISIKKYDLFISHASKDKSTFVDELYETFSKLGIRIFYDKEVISWGDNWKKVILEGTEQSEFAVIVISNNFFGREWTERELNEFLQRQNSSNQKIILPLLYGVTRDDLLEKYPTLSEIQYISSEDYSVDEICILFAKELIKRIRT